HHHDQGPDYRDYPLHHAPPSIDLPVVSTAGVLIIAPGTGSVVGNPYAQKSRRPAMSDSQSVRARPVRRQQSRRQWSRLAVVFTTMVILFGVPWWTLLAAGTGWPDGVVVAGSLVFVTAFVALPAMMMWGHGRRHRDWAATIGDMLLGVVWVLFVWSVLAQLLRL